MIKVYVYSLSDGAFYGIESGMPNEVIGDLSEGYGFTLTPPPDREHFWRWINDKWVADEPEPTPIEQHQAEVWELIKAKRLEQTISGVLVKSVGKVFHTDPVSAIQYSSVAGMIALGNYTPIEWKVQDNSWLSLTEELFRELQVAMRANTQQAYVVAEQHKAAMMQSDDPLGYDYQSGWPDGVVEY